MRFVGFLSGIGLLALPVLTAGILATVIGLLGSESWSPEHTFPWLYLASWVACLAGIGFGSVRYPGFGRGASLGAMIAVVVLGGVYLLALVAQP